MQIVDADTMNKKDLIKEARRANAARGETSVNMDADRIAPEVVPLDDAGFAKWQGDPGHYDLQGIDSLGAHAGADIGGFRQRCRDTRGKFKKCSEREETRD
jgi:hypothetical protein